MTKPNPYDEMLRKMGLPTKAEVLANSAANLNRVRRMLVDENVKAGHGHRYADRINADGSLKA